MGFLTNHRTRQAGKYAKLSYQQQRAASMSVPPPPAPTYVPAPQPVQSTGGFKDGYEKGWREGQRDLVAAIQSGRLTWEEAIQRLT